jgi:protein kinase
MWAVGAIMAELYNMKPLFQGSSETDQLFKICSVLGTPGGNNWPEGVRLATNLGIRLPQFFPTSLASIIPGASPEAIDLLTELLRFDPAKRPNASQALQHPFFKGEKRNVQTGVVTDSSLRIERPMKIAVDSMMKSDEIDRILVKSVDGSYNAPSTQLSAPILPKIGSYPFDNEVLKQEPIDDIFDGIL